MRSKWTEKDIEMLRLYYCDTQLKDLSKLLGKSAQSIYGMAYKLGFKRSEFFLAENCRFKKGTNTGANFRFKKGQTSWNKGVKKDQYIEKMPNDSYLKMIKTCFKKGNTPHNACPVGYEVLRKDKGGKSYWMIKIAESSKLVYKHKHIWEQANGPITKGHNIIFKDGNTHNCTIENLECISNAELMRRNSIQRFPPELISTIKLLHKLKRKTHGTQQN